MARRLDRLQTLAEALRQQYRIDVVAEQVDLSDVEAVIQLHQRLRERGIAIDILINIAGHGLQGPFVDGKLGAALAMPQLDVASLTAVTHVFAQDMRTRGRGKILLVASLLAYQGVQAAMCGREDEAAARLVPTSAGNKSPLVGWCDG